MYLYDKLDAWREGKFIKPVPEYVAANLKFDLRPYQREAFENFITHFESETCPRPTQVLFNMATGSGKTLIMAGLILYLYKRGYRNFLFFVNLTNIVDKTRENFLNSQSTKYLFAEEIILDGQRIRINATENFQYADDDAINICFTTTQALHMTMNLVKENSMTPEDFKERKVVLISDEAHHLNVVTKKKLSATEEEHRETWEDTVEKIFSMNAENILLEFTATCDLSNPSIKKKYEPLIVFKYTLLEFYNNGYSKEIMTLRAELEDRIFFALVLSQYRLKIFQDNRLSIKPVILFKAFRKDECKAFMKKFIDDVKNLRGEKLRALSEKNSDKIIRRAFDYFLSKGISFDALAAELRDEFSAGRCILVIDDKEAERNQILLNTLEDSDNPYRAVFEVKKLDEGWDVLNLFDIVRLYETRSSKETLTEAQLIGRGARYCPFQLDDEQPKFQRKYDRAAEENLRVCETLYYHCQNDRRYISELHEALKKIGMEADKKIFRREYKLKESFKRDELYQRGVIFLNAREKVSENFCEVVPKNLYDFERVVEVGSEKILAEDVDIRAKNFHPTRRTIGEIAAKNYAVVHKALMKFPVYDFDKLKTRFKNLKSTRQFITDAEYLGDIGIDIKSNETELSIETLYAAAFDVLKKISVELEKPAKIYRGTTKFFPRNIHEIFHDKVLNFSDARESQNDLNLSTEDWFAYNDNFGTSEEKAFVAYFKNRVDELKKIYDKIFLVRNEREFKIFSFEDGATFEPDYVLFLQKENSASFEQFQIFIEPKGEHLSAKDSWKEKFLLELKSKVLVDDGDYKIWGLRFFNQNNLRDFDSEFRALLKI